MQPVLQQTHFNLSSHTLFFTLNVINLTLNTFSLSSHTVRFTLNTVHLIFDVIKPFSRICMREVTKVTKIKCEVGFCIDMKPFLINLVTTGHEMASRIGLCKNDSTAF